MQETIGVRFSILSIFDNLFCKGVYFRLINMVFIKINLKAKKIFNLVCEFLISEFWYSKVYMNLKKNNKYLKII